MSDSHFNAGNDRGFEPVAGQDWESSSPNDWAAGVAEACPAPLAKPQLDWHAFVEWLPRLGPQLWSHRPRADRVFPRARLLPRGVLLLDHPALAALADCAQVTARSDVATFGPREWLEFRTARDECSARLYLLPDTDYLAWDGMLADCAIERVKSRPSVSWHAHTAFLCSALSRLRSPWQAYVTRFPLLHLPCLQVLGMRQPDSLSVFGAQIAAAIAADDRAVLQPPTISV